MAHMENNGLQPPPGMGPGRAPLPEHKPPANLEPASLMTFTMKVSDKSIVTMIADKPGSTWSINLLADDAIKWGEQLVQAGRDAISGLIRP